MRIEFAKGEMTNMKRLTKIALGACLIISMVISYIVGNQMKEQEMRRNRSQQCNTLISFAIDKAENHDLADQDIMEALISNVYAAYQFCDDSVAASQLHELWNGLIFEGDSFTGKEDVLVERLQNIAEMINSYESE